MRVLHINTTSHIGGAARAMRRFSQALIENGHQSKFLVGRSKFSDDPVIHLIWEQVARFRTPSKGLKSRIGNWLEKYYGIHPWSNLPNLRITETALYEWADIIDLRNLFGGFFNLWSLPELSSDKPVVWRLPDLWAVTGHCAYPYDCERWKTGCYRCPLLTPEGRKIVEPPPTLRDGTRRVWKAKKTIYDRSRLHLIVTTDWMRVQVAQSILGDARSINVISNGVNLETYRPQDKKLSREKLGLPSDERILVWAAGGKGNYRKGYHLAVEALEVMQKSGAETPMLITMGSEEGWSKPDKLRKIKHFGYVSDPDQQALIYTAADAFLCPTLADGQPQTVLESIACGTPVIAFDIGPMPEEVQDGVTGILVNSRELSKLRDGIERFFLAPVQHRVMGENCRKQALRKYDLRVQTGKYIDLYQGILDEK